MNLEPKGATKTALTSFDLDLLYCTARNDLHAWIAANCFFHPKHVSEDIAAFSKTSNQ